MVFLIKKSVAKEILKSLGKNKLEELKQEVIEILKKQDEKEYKKALNHFLKEEENYSYLTKSISGEWIEKAGYGIGTVRIWKGKKYKKIAPGKWARMYEKEGRGTNIAVGKLIAKVKKIDDIEELMNFVMQNKQRFQDENGMDLPVLDKLRAAIDARNNGGMGSKATSKPANYLKDNPYEMTETEKKGAMKNPKSKLLQLADAVRNTEEGTDEYYTALSVFQNAREEFIENQGMAEYKEIMPDYPKGKSKKPEEKKEETNIDNDFNKMIARIKSDYPNMPKEAEESLKEEYKRMGISKEKWIEYREKLFKNKEEEKKREEQRKQEKNNEKEEKINKYVKHIKNQLGIGDVGDFLYKKEEYVSILNDTIQKYGKKSIMGIAAQRIIDNMKESEPKKDEKYTDNAKFVKEVKGDVWEEWNTDPNKFAVIYDKNTGKSKGLRMTQDIVDIINSVVEPSVLDWQDNVAEKVHKKYPEIKESYIKENIKPIRMGYRNGSQEKIQILNKESETEKQKNNFSLDDIKSKKTIKTVEEFEDVIRQLAAEKNQDNAESKFIDFLGYNLEGGMAGRLYDKIFEKYGDTSYSTLKKQVKGQKISEREKNIGYADEYANKEEEKSKKKENSKNIQNQMTPKQQKTFDDFEKKAIKKAGTTDRGKRFAKHNYNIDGEDWTITTDGRVMLCSREKFEEPTKTDKITNMDKVFVINGQKESAIPDGIDAIIKAAPKTVVTGKDYNGKEKKEPSIIKLGDRYFNTDYLKTVQNFLGPLSNVKMQVIPEDNKSRVKFESGNKAVVLLPIENSADLENRIINTNDIKKSLEDIIMFYNDFEDEDEEIEDAIKNDESLFNDYSAENPSEFNSIKYKVANAFDECGY